MIEHPHGVWIWELAKIHRNYLDLLKQQNCRRVYLKVFDGASRSMFWAHQCSKALIDKFHNAGMEVYGWGYHYGTPDIDAQTTAIRKALDCGIDGYIFDVEQEIKNPSTHNNVKNLIQSVRPHVRAGTLGYTSFGHPGYHREIPWQLLDGLCDLALPQIYFEKFGFDNDEAEVKSCIEAHKQLGLKKPILPIWGSEEDATKPASIATLQKFMAHFPGSSVFRVPNIGQKGEAFHIDYAGKTLDIEEEPLPIATKPSYALFRMQLDDSTSLMVGNLFLFDANNKQIFDAVATSGQPGYQSFDDLWKPAQGPIPNLANLEIATEGGEIESRDIKGLFFSILPYTLENPNTGGTRGGFGVYNDAGAPGTSGGIGIVNLDSYDRFCAIMASANRAGIERIALKVEYAGRSRATAAKPAKALFKMQLANTSRQLWGSLFLFDAAGKQIFDAVATSGLAGYQGADDLWKPRLGPIPALSGKTINTQGIYMPHKPGINGWFFKIEPYWFVNPRTGRKERGDFGVHFDANVVGSSGCIVIQNKSTFDRFRDIMVAARRAGVNQIPIQVEYSSTRSISTRGGAAKGISIHIGLNRVSPEHYQGWDGQLNACENDAMAMQAIAEQKGFASQLILSEQATCDRVKQALSQAAQQLEPGDMLLLTYSGHGGQIPDESDGDEEDNFDETWILYDRELIDDELYTLYGQFKSGVRICVISDSCHSGTVTRSRLYKNLAFSEPTNGISREDAYGFRTPELPKIRAIPQEVQNQTYYTHQRLYRKLQKSNSGFERDNIAASVILISGCQDNQLSLDGVTNGFFTETLLTVWNRGEYKAGYRDLRRDIGLLMPPWQSPHYYTVGTPNLDFENQIPFTINSQGSSEEDSTWNDVVEPIWSSVDNFSNSNENGHNQDDLVENFACL